jgi:hypothetical protein
MLPACSALAQAVGAVKTQVEPLDDELLDEDDELLDDEEDEPLDDDELLDEVLLDEEDELLDEVLVGRPPASPPPPAPPIVSSVAPLAQARSAMQPEARIR